MCLSAVSEVEPYASRGARTVPGGEPAARRAPTRRRTRLAITSYLQKEELTKRAGTVDPSGPRVVWNCPVRGPPRGGKPASTRFCDEQCGNAETGRVSGQGKRTARDVN